MSTVTLKGESGGELKVVEWNGIYFPSYSNSELLLEVSKTHFRPEDVIICCYPKCGTHWVFEMVNMLIAGRAEPVTKVWHNLWLEHPSCTPHLLQQQPSPRVLISHLPFHKLPEGIRKVQCRLVVMERNIKDATASMYAMTSRKKEEVFTGAWDSFVTMFLSGETVFNSYFVHMNSYRRARREPEQKIAIFSYEKFKQDHVGHLGRLSAFLGLDSSPQLLADIAALTDFKSMKQYKKKDDFVQNLFQGDGNVMFRKGEVGDWKNWFTVAQSEMFDAEYLRQMGEPFQETEQNSCDNYSVTDPEA